MADRPGDVDSPPGVPRWVKLSAIIGGLMVVAVVVVLHIVQGDHGPGQHAPGEEPSDVEAPGEQAPPDGGRR